MPAAAIIIVYLLWFIIKREQYKINKYSSILILSTIIPFIIGISALGLYNIARFGKWSEFGGRYQLTGLQQNLLYDSEVFSSKHILPNLYNYILRTPQYQEKFPYIRAYWWPREYPEMIIPSPNYFNVEPVLGIVPTTPWSLFVLTVPLLLLKKKNSLVDKDTQSITILLLSLIIFASGPVMFYIFCTMRYALDFSIPILLLSTIGYWKTLTILKTSNYRNIFQALALALLLISILFGALLGTTGYYDRLEKQNRILFNNLEYFNQSLFVLQKPEPSISLYIENPNGIENIENKTLMWIGKGETILTVVSNRNGFGVIRGSFIPGPSIPESQERRLIIKSLNMNTEITIGNRVAEIVVPLRTGVNTIILNAPESPTIDILPNGDRRRLILGIQNLDFTLLNEK